MQKTQADLTKTLYRDKDIDHLTYTGDWVDIRISAVTSVNVGATDDKLEQLRYSQHKNGNTVHIAKGSKIKIWHGFCLELQPNTEALVRPRGSLFSKTGLIFACSGVIDNGYNGDNDEWFTTYYATENVILTINERICQFRTFDKQPAKLFKPVESLGNKDRGGHGSTGGYAK